jgi:hypothetical protein
MLFFTDHEADDDSLPPSHISPFFYRHEPEVGNDEKRRFTHKLSATMKVPLSAVVLLAAFFSTLAAADDSTASPAAASHGYASGYKTTMRLGSDLYKALEPKRRMVMHAVPVWLETELAPSIRPLEYPDDPKPLRIVFISVGFVDLMNNVAHAKAIDKITPGYFENYIMKLSAESGEKALTDLAGISEERFWSDDMLNEQQSNFNQMAGMVLAIDMSHHYLGHYQQYQNLLVDGKGHFVPINNLLTESEWRQSVREGVRNALDCGLGVDGLKALYECIGKMPLPRPPWTAYFLPSKAKVPTLLRELETLEAKYFKGQ